MSAVLDGNAIAGALVDVFGAEMTAATATCASCGARAHVGELAVYLALGTVVRCPSCGAVMMVLVTRGELTCVDLRGVAAFDA